MKKEQNKHEEMYTLEQVQSLAALIAAGILGITGQECFDEAEKLPVELKKVLVASILAARDTIKSIV